MNLLLLLLDDELIGTLICRIFYIATDILISHFRTDRGASFAILLV